jgi:hypothetical protein
MPTRAWTTCEPGGSAAAAGGQLRGSPNRPRRGGGNGANICFPRRETGTPTIPPLIVQISRPPVPKLVEPKLATPMV